MTAEGRLKRRTSIHGPGNCQKPRPSLRSSAKSAKAAASTTTSAWGIGALGARQAQQRETARSGDCGEDGLPLRRREKDPRRDQRRAGDHGPELPRRALGDSRRHIHAFRRSPFSTANPFLREGGTSRKSALQPGARRLITRSMCPKGVRMAWVHRLAFAVSRPRRLGRGGRRAAHAGQVGEAARARSARQEMQYRRQ